MKNCIILGARSDIAQQLMPLLEADGWTITGWTRDDHGKAWFDAAPRWDLIICAIGRVAPVGHWAEQDVFAWEETIDSNVLLPIRLLRVLWPKRKENAAVCFFAGANPNKPMENYSAYSVGKMALLKAVEHLDLESPDCKLFALAPGVVLTKIHEATIASGVKNERLERALRGDVVPIWRIYGCLKWCLQQPKEVIGGRNICVSDPWDKPKANLPEVLTELRNFYKLRRCE